MQSVRFHWKQVVLILDNRMQIVYNTGKVTFDAAGVINPEKFTAITKRLLKSRVIGQTPDGRYYII